MYGWANGNGMMKKLDHRLKELKESGGGGATMTDEAVKIVIERLEALKDGKGN